MAVKVLHAQALSPQLVQRFADEADTMAALEHPNIVRVYSSGVTADGRPYIEMAYYPEETLAQAVKEGPLSVSEALRVGIQLASAVEAAHQVGLLHRDIKPANVLIDKFGDPALTDFGIASHLHQIDDSESSLSVPWAPPEAMFATEPLDRRADVYSLAATLWHILVGHSPFELPGGDNRPTVMMVRIRDLPVPATGRSDVPASLERLLRQAMSKQPRLRPPTAEVFARSLGAIEEELHLRPTPFKLARSVGRATPPAPPSAGRARSRSQSAGPLRSDGLAQPVSSLRSGVPVGPSSPAILPSQGGLPLAEDATVQRGGATIRRSQPGTQSDLARSGPAQPGAEVAASLEETAPRQRRAILIGALILLLVAAGLAAWVVFGPEAPPPDPELPTVTVDPAGGGIGAAVDAYPGQPVITGAVEGDRVVFSWTYDHEDPSDFYWVSLGDGSAEKVEDPSYATGYQGSPVCLMVRVARASGAYAQIEPTEGCVS